MTVTQATMTDLPSNNSSFLSTSVDEPEVDSINFRQSLRFFQEQLVINGSNPSSPSPSFSSNESANKYALRFSNGQNIKSETLENSKNNIISDEGTQALRGGKIPDIPTVDTILESVRVLRAIQKSQEQRGSLWTLDVDSTNVECGPGNFLSNSIEPLHNDVENGFICNDLTLDNEMKADSCFIDNFDLSTVNDVESDIEFNHHRKEVNTFSVESLKKTILVNSANISCPFWPSNVIPIEKVNLDRDELHHEINSGTCDSNANLNEIYVNGFANGDVDLTESLNLKSSMVAKTTEKLINHTAETIVVSEDSDHRKIENSDQIIILSETNDINKNAYVESNCSIDSSNFSSQNEVGDDVECNIPAHDQNLSDDDIDLATSMNISEDSCGDPKFDDQLCNDGLVMVMYENGERKEFIHRSVDCDSGLGTEKSISISSPTHQTESGRDSWSDASSSHYVSAECSPCASLNSVFETPIGINGDTSRKSGNAVETEHKKEVSGDICTAEPRETSPDDEFLKGYRLCNSLYEDDTESPEPSSYSSIEFYNEPVSITDEPVTVETVTETEVVDCLSKLDGVSLDDKERTSQSENVITDEVGDVTEPEYISGNSSNSCIYSSFTSIDLAPPSPCTKPCDEGIVSPCASDKFQAEKSITTGISEINLTLHIEPQNVPVENGISKQQALLYEESLDIPESVSDVVPNKICDKSKESVQHTTESIPSTIEPVGSDEDDGAEISRIKKTTTSSWNPASLLESLYKIKEVPSFEGFHRQSSTFEGRVFIFARDAFSQHPEGYYHAVIEDNFLKIVELQENQVCLHRQHLTDGKIEVLDDNAIKIDSKLGLSLYIKLDSGTDMHEWKSSLQDHLSHPLKTECLNIVHYPLKCHKNIIIIDLGSCSTRAGILMDQPTLPSLFFPTVCATDKVTSQKVYGMEALLPQIRQSSNLSFPVRPSAKITKYTMDIGTLKGLFQKVFLDLKVDPQNYSLEVCIPRSMSIQTQVALVDLLLNDLKVKAVSLTRQSILTLYAYEAPTGIVVDIGDRMEIIPVVDGFMVEGGVTCLPHGGERLLHHFKHALAEKHISLSSDMESFVVQYIIENLAYVADNYENEMLIYKQHPDGIKKTVELHQFINEENIAQSVTLDYARCKVPEGIFDPRLWGLDVPGVHKLVQKAIQACGVDVRRKIAENVYISGGVSLLPGFAERLQLEVAKLNSRVKPCVHASRYRHHASYIGACKFASLEEFRRVCVDATTFNKAKTASIRIFSL